MWPSKPSQYSQKGRSRPIVWASAVALLQLLVVVSVRAQNSKPYDCDCRTHQCPKQPDECDGIIMPEFDLPCGCCDMCVTYLKEGQACKIAAPKPDYKACSPGLVCSKDTAVCVRPVTPCTQQSALLGQESSGFSPECDEFGKYVGRQCVSGSVCYCVDDNGNRIQGEAPVTESEGMDCRCARDRLKIEASYNARLTETSELPVCLTNGNYDYLQCSDSAGVCYCIGNATDPWPGATTPVSQEFFHLLPCYDASIHETLPRNKPCFKELREYKEGLSQNEPIIPDTSPPICGVDGNFRPVQFDVEQSRKYCSDPDGNVIEDFSVGMKTPAAVDMNCYCARARYWASTSDGYMPTCCPNGNYLPWQCNGPTCTCVDQITGQPIGETVDESDKPTLEGCYNLHPCADAE